MNKAEQREVQKAINFANLDPRYAAATLSGVMRSANKKSFFEMVAVMNDFKLRDHMEVVNGCYVAKSTHPADA